MVKTKSKERIVHLVFTREYKVTLFLFNKNIIVKEKLAGHTMYKRKDLSIKALKNNNSNYNNYQMIVINETYEISGIYKASKDF